MNDFTKMAPYCLQDDSTKNTGMDKQELCCKSIKWFTAYAYNQTAGKKWNFEEERLRRKLEAASIKV